MKVYLDKGNTDTNLKNKDLEGVKCKRCGNEISFKDDAWYNVQTVKHATFSKNENYNFFMCLKCAPTEAEAQILCDFLVGLIKL